MKKTQINQSDFNILIDEGNVGFYQSCEITQLFIQKKSDGSIFNFFILASFEEKPYLKFNHQFLTKPIKINSEYTLGIQRYWLSIEQVKKNFEQLNTANKWNVNDNTALNFGKLNGLAKQFIPAREEQRMNNALKNNFHNGSYILEFFDESKSNVAFLLEMKKLKRLNEISEEIKKHLAIDFSVIRDRIGNVVFQFPITTLYTNSNALSSWDGVNLNFLWHKKVLCPPDCFIQVESKLDKNYMGGAIEEYNKLKSQQVIIGSLDQINHIKIWRKTPSLLLSTFDGGYLREFIFNQSIISHEPRIFEIDGIVHKLTVSGKGMRSGKAEEIKYTTYINNNLYEAEKSNLEKTLSFKQYFKGSSVAALNDIQELVKRNSEYGVDLWDPYLRAKDILQVLFYSSTKDVPLRAIGSIDPSTNKFYKTKGAKKTKIISSEKAILDSSENNNYGINLEFRFQFGNHGWAFHDRFLIFHGNIDNRPKVYSLGTSINSLGKSHHILQEVSHPQRVIDAFEELWIKLSHKDCLVWKYPKI